MANSETAAKARLGKLKKQADDLGISYHEDVTEETLKLAIKAAKEETEEEAPATSAVSAVEIGKAIAQEMGKVMRTVVQEPDEDGLVDDRDVDPDDIGEEKVYFTPQFFWIVPAKRIGGQLVKAPYKKMVFKMSHGDAIRNGDQFQTRYMSTYVTNSKREQAYLETHDLYKKIFFSNAKEADITSDQVKFAQKFSQHMQNLNVRMAPQLYRMAAENGIKLDSKMSLSTIRTNIANALAARDIQRDAEMMKSMVSSAGRASLLSDPTAEQQ